MEREPADSAVLFESLVEPCRRRLWTFVRRMVGDEATAEDLYQEALLHAWRALPGYRERGRFLSWLFRIAHNVVRNDRRKRGVRPVLVAPPDGLDPPDPATADDRLRAGEVRRRLDQQLHDLTTEQREVFLLRMHSDLSFREIAELTGAPLSTVINRMRDALGKLADVLEECR